MRAATRGRKRAARRFAQYAIPPPRVAKRVWTPPDTPSSRAESDNPTRKVEPETSTVPFGRAGAARARKTLITAPSAADSPAVDKQTRFYGRAILAYRVRRTTARSLSLTRVVRSAITLPATTVRAVKRITQPLTPAAQLSPRAVIRQTRAPPFALPVYKIADAGVQIVPLFLRPVIQIAVGAPVNTGVKPKVVARVPVRQKTRLIPIQPTQTTHLSFVLPVGD